jgi:DNA N-6-adenine-methyltransferase (Dam).
MAILVKSKTPDGDKNFWATTWECFADAEHLFGRKFIIDVAAEPLTAKCKLFFTQADDALSLDWPDSWFLNPPFDLKAQFIHHAKQQQSNGRAGMMLLPYEPCTKWWAETLRTNVICYVPDGRYSFLERDGRTKKNGVNFASCFVLFPCFKIQNSIHIPFSRGCNEQV